MNHESLMKNEKLLALITSISEAIAKNCSSAPQLIFPHLHIGIKDLLELISSDSSFLSALASQAQHPIATLVLGGIDCDEYGDNEIEWNDSSEVEDLQEKLVNGSNPVSVPLYMAPQAQQDHIGDANKMVVAQPEFERLTEFKASELRKQGYKDIGVVLKNEFNQVGIVAHSSVRWFHTQEDFFDFMHPSEQLAQEPMNELEALRTKLETAVSRISDMLESDDGQAHKEARKFIESLPAPEYQELESKGG